MRMLNREIAYIVSTILRAIKKLSYGLFVGGNINKKKAALTHYGPFINWQQPIWKDWVFIQPEVHFYNDKKQNRKHHFGAFLRLEAIF